MTREEAQKLLGGYATGNLSREQQQALFEAALDDQQLFDALAAEQPLHDLLSDDAARRQLLAGIDRPAPKRRWWLIPGFALAATAAAVLAFVALKPQPQHPVILAEMAQPPVAAPALTVPAVQPQSPAHPEPRVADRPHPRARAATPQQLADAVVPLREKAATPQPSVTAETAPLSAGAPPPQPSAVASTSQNIQVSAAPIAAPPPPQPAAVPATSQTVEVTAAAGKTEAQPVQAPVTNGMFMSRNSAFGGSITQRVFVTVQLRQPDGTYTAIDPKELKAGNTARVTIAPPFSGVLTVTRNPGNVVLTKPTPVDAHGHFDLDVTSEKPDVQILKIELKPPGMPPAVQSVTLIFQ